MEKGEVENSTSSEECNQLNRNRSFKSKQLVRSQAIRESQSPPRAASPASPVRDAEDASDVANDVISDKQSSASDNNDDCRRHQVEIQITPGAWDEPSTDQRQRTKRWLGNKQHSRDLLSNNPRVACVCGACTACPHCRGRRRKYLCPTKQDSGIVCSDECPDCSDTETTGPNTDGARKTNSLDRDDTTFYCRCPERKEKPKSISLSRTDSDDRSEPTGPELVKFIKDTLNKNARDRVTLLKIEKELHALINDTGRCIVRFPVMTSYGRMLVHRCAALFQLSHHLDQSNKTCVLVSKSGTSGGRIPCTSFKQWCTATFPPSPQRHHADTTHAKSILKRDTNSLDEGGAGGASAARSKSLEQREREYERVRRRIFSSDNCSQDESNQWQWMNSGPIKVLAPEGGRNKLLKVQSLEGSGANQRPLSGRGPVSKSHSFGGYARAPDAPRLLSRQGDLASSSWRLSPSSSGYRTLSLHSTDSVTPSPTGGASPEPPPNSVANTNPGVAVLWAVTEFSAVPPGTLLIHPQTGRPLTNPDGSLYHFDPSRPPTIDAVYTQTDKIDANCEKKRGRLEKQHSFIDNECECQPSEECVSKCCCECRRHDSCHRSNDKISTQTEKKIHQKPASPCKTRYEQPPESPANHNPPDTNHRPVYDPAANQTQAPDYPPNHRSVYDVAQNYNQSPNLRPGFEMRTPYETNQRQERQFEIQRPPSYDANQKFDSANQRGPGDSTNHRPMRLTNHGTPEVQYISQQYQQTYSHEEVTSPQVVAPQYVHQELAGQHMASVKPVTLQDPNMRTMPLQMVYPNVGQYFGSPLSVYQPVVEEKPVPPVNNTFTIDPSYPYAPVDYGHQCAACVDPPAPPARPYALYAPLDPNMQYQHYQYQDPMQWQNVQPVVQLPQHKMFVPELYPLMQYPNVQYPQYNVLYPQMVPQSFPVYPSHERRHSASAPHRHSKRNSLTGSSRNTPLASTPEDKKVPHEDTTVSDPIQNQTAITAGQSQNITNQTTQVQSLPQNQNLPSQGQIITVHNQLPPQQTSSRDSAELAAKIKQINEQMSQMQTTGRRDEWRRRSSGGGILGCHPRQGGAGRMPSGEEVQLSSAARAIVNSIRSMQTKNYQDRRDYPGQCRERRPDYRPRDERARPLPVYTPDYILRQMSPATWVRRSPAPVHPVFNPRRPHPDPRGGRR